MPQIIIGTEALPTPQMGSKGRLEYLRSKQDPYALIACRTGVVYLRKCGLRWESPAYQIDRAANDSLSIAKVSAYCDTERFDGSEP